MLVLISSTSAVTPSFSPLAPSYFLAFLCVQVLCKCPQLGKGWCISRQTCQSRAIFLVIPQLLALLLLTVIYIVFSKYGLQTLKSRSSKVLEVTFINSLHNQSRFENPCLLLGETESKTWWFCCLRACFKTWDSEMLKLTLPSQGNPYTVQEISIPTEVVDWSKLWREVKWRI